MSKEVSNNTSLDSIKQNSTVSFNNFDINKSQEFKPIVQHSSSIKTQVEKTKYHVNNIFTKIVRFFQAKPLIKYCFNRIFYGLLTMFIGIALLFLIVRSAMDDTQFLTDTWMRANPNWQTQPQIVYNYLYNPISGKLTKLGLDGSLISQMFRYLINIIPFIPKQVPTITEDAVGTTYTAFFYLGVVSSKTIAGVGTPLSKVFATAMPNSLFVGGLGVLLAYIVGIPLGVECGRRYLRRPDSVINGIATFLLAVPSLIIVIVFYLINVLTQLPLMWATGSIVTRIFPILAIFFMLVPAEIIMTRRYVIDEMTSDYTSLATSKGLSKSKIFYVHIFRNAGIRVVRNIPASFILAIFGVSLLTETKWGIPGMANIITKATSPGQIDTMTVMGYTTVVTFVSIFTALLSDLIMVWLDPRITLSKK